MTVIAFIDCYQSFMTVIDFVDYYYESFMTVIAFIDCYQSFMTVIALIGTNFSNLVLMNIECSTYSNPCLCLGTIP